MFLDLILAPVLILVRALAFLVGYLSDDPFYLVLLVVGTGAVIYVWRKVK